MDAGDDEAFVSAMLRKSPSPVIGEWRPSVVLASSSTTIQTLTFGAPSIQGGLRCERAKAVLACKGPDGSPWVVGVVMRERDGWGFRQRGAILLGDARAIVRWRDGREEMEIAGVGRATLRKRGLAIFGRPFTDYVLESGDSIVVRVPRIFSTLGLARWQFGLIRIDGEGLGISAGPLRGFVRTRMETLGREAPDPRCLEAIDPAKFAVLKRATSLGSPLLSHEVARELEGAAESLRLLVVMGAVWERMRYEGPGGD